MTKPDGSDIARFSKHPRWPWFVLATVLVLLGLKVLIDGTNIPFRRRTVEAVECQTHLYEMQRAMRDYASDHGGALPASLDALSPAYLKEEHLHCRASVRDAAVPPAT